ncbi:MAG: hypothetical protein ABI353_20435 [Isosphaeraceae bacterium]
MFKIQGTSRPTRYDLWIEPNGQEQGQVIVAVAALLGLDPRLARKLVESGSPVRRRVSEAEVRSLHARFGHWGLGVRVSPSFPSLLDRPEPLSLKSPADEPIILVVLRGWMAQGFVGLVLGGLAGIAVLGAAWDWLPSQVGLPPEVSGPSMLAQEAILLIVPLMVSCAIGLFWGFRRPGLTLRGLMGLVGVVAVLLFLEVEGLRNIGPWLDRGQSSDDTGVGATLIFQAFCTAIAAPLSAILARGSKESMS